MARGVKIEGTDRLQALAVQLKAADKVMLAGLRVQLKGVAALVIPAVRESAIATLPSSGGRNETGSRALNERVARAPYRATTTLGAKSVAVSVRSRAGNRHLKDINAGTVRHPLFGDRNHWYTTPVKPGYFTTPLEGMAPAIRVRMRVVMDATDLAMGFKKGHLSHA